MNVILHRLFQDRAVLTYPIGLALAILVTVHVLLRKRELASAAGWIGFAWFAPVTGTLGYALFGVNRVKRRARKLGLGSRMRGQRPPAPEPGGEGETLGPLQRGMQVLTGRPLLGGNAVDTYQSGDAAYPQMLDAIAAAQHSVGMSSYIFRDDVWGGRFIDALTQASRRGVQTRVLIDGIGGGWLLSSAYHHLRRNGVTAERFLHSPLPWRMPFLNLRSHRKILVVDGTLGFTGGMNVADQNVLAARAPAPVQDTHFRLTGPVVAQLAEAFAADWSFASGEDLQGDAWFPNIKMGEGAPARVVTSGPDQDIEKLEFAMLQAVSCARARVLVMTPYFLPDDRLAAALSLAAMRGVSVEVIIPAHSDHKLVDWAFLANIGPLLTDGVRVWRSPPPFRHSKIMTVDGDWTLIGSCNWDIRSFRLNFELCVEVYDSKLAASLETFMAGCRGREVTRQDIDGRSLPAQLRDAGSRLLLPYL